MTDPDRNLILEPVLGPGARVRQYEIEREIGRGSSAIVYRAHDAVLGRDVALKCLRPDRAMDGPTRHRFLRESKAASRLSHPNVVPIYEVFEHGELPWIAMQFVDGLGLRQILAQGTPLDVRDILRYGEDLCGALQAAHEKHVIHRDVNPNNVLITRDGRALLTDFGVARFTNPADMTTTTHSTELTGDGGLIGTLPYISPEQVLGRTLDGRSDIFSLGALLYELCTGKLAFPATEVPNLLDSILHHEPEPISRHNYSIPDELERIVRKALRKDPAERYQEAREMLADVRALRRTTDSDGTGGKWFDAHRPRPHFLRGRVVAALVAAALVIGVAAGALFRRPPAAWLPEDLRPIRLTADDTWDGSPALSPDGREVAFASVRSGNSDVWVIDTRGGRAQQLTDDPVFDGLPAWYPDGQMVAFVSDRGGHRSIWQVPRRGGEATLVLTDAVDPAISPDGTKLAFSRTDASGAYRIGVASLSDTSDAHLITHEKEGLWNHFHPVWSPDGRILVYSDHQDLWRVDPSGANAAALTRDGQINTHPTWSHDGRFIIFASQRGGTHALWRLTWGSGEIQRLTFGTGPEQSPSTCQAGTGLAYSTETSTEDIAIRDVTGGAETPISGPQEELFPAYAPDGQSLVFSSDRWGKLDLWVQPLKEGLPEGPPRRLTDHPGKASYPAYSPDGRWIAYYRILEGQRDVWVISASGGQSYQFTSDPSSDYHPAWSPDGSRIAFASERNGVPQIWEAPVRDGRPAGPARLLTPDLKSAMAPRWSPDGTRIACVESMEWIVVFPATAGSAPALTIRLSGVEKVRWMTGGAELMASVHDEQTGETRLYRVALPEGSVQPVEPAVLLGTGEKVYPDFDLSPDGRRVVYTQNRLHGDIWALLTRDIRY